MPKITLPKVCLLEGEGSDFSLNVGAGMFSFVAGKAKSVPVAVALLAAKKTKRDGSPLFEITGLPKVIAKQNVNRKPQQMRFDLCH